MAIVYKRVSSIHSNFSKGAYLPADNSLSILFDSQLDFDVCILSPFLIQPAISHTERNQIMVSSASEKLEVSRVISSFLLLLFDISPFFLFFPFFAFIDDSIKRLSVSEKLEILRIISCVLFSIFFPVFFYILSFFFSIFYRLFFYLLRRSLL